MRFVVAQGHVIDNIELMQPGLRYKEPVQLLRNVNSKFQDVSMASGPAFLAPVAGRGAAFGDLNNDGFVDVAVNCNDGAAMVLMNRGGNGNHWISLKLRGSGAGAVRVCDHIRELCVG